MLPTTAESQRTAATPPAATPEKNTCLNNRTMKLALAALASLAAFVFLPFPTAFLITAVVTLGVFFCTGESNLLTCASAAVKGLKCFGGEKPKPVEPALPVISKDPTEVTITSPAKAQDGFSKVRLTFQSSIFRNEFLRLHRGELELLDCFMIEGNANDVLICNRSWHKKDVPASFLLELKLYFPQSNVLNEICKGLR